MMKRSLLSKTPSFEDAFISSIIRYGESDCIVRVFFKDIGRQTLFYKKAFSSKKRESYGIQSLCFAKISYIYPKTDGMLTLCSLDFEPEGMALAKSLRVFAFASYVAEILEIFIPENEPAQEIFYLIKDLIKIMNKEGAHPQLLRAFELKLLKFCGYLPDISCAKIKAKEILAFDVRQQTFLDEPNLSSIEFSNEALRIAEMLLVSPIDKIFCSDNKLLKMIGRLFICRLRLFRKEQLKSETFFKEINSK